MPFKSLSKLVKSKNSSDNIDNRTQKVEIAEKKLAEKQQKEAIKQRGKKVLPANAATEEEYKNLNARLFRIEMDMQAARAEVMKPRSVGTVDQAMESRASLSSFQRAPMYVPAKLAAVSPTSATPGPPLRAPGPGVHASPPPEARSRPASRRSTSSISTLPVLHESDEEEAEPSNPLEEATLQPTRRPSPLAQTAFPESALQRAPSPEELTYTLPHGERETLHIIGVQA